MFFVCSRSEIDKRAKVFKSARRLLNRVDEKQGAISRNFIAAEKVRKLKMMKTPKNCGENNSLLDLTSKVIGHISRKKTFLENHLQIYLNLFLKIFYQSANVRKIEQSA